MQSFPKPRLLRDIVPSAVEMMRDRATGKCKPVPLRLVFNGEANPWTDAEAALGGGLWPGLYVLVGADGVGKTQLCMSLGLGAAMEGSPVAYIGLDTNDCEFVTRFLGLLTSRSWRGLNFGTATFNAVLGNQDFMAMVGTDKPTVIDMPSMQRATQDLSKLPIQLVDGSTTSWTPDQIEVVAQQLVSMAEERGIDTKLHPPLIVLDSLQLIGDSPNLPLGVRQRMNEATLQAKQVANRYGVAVLAVSSVARTTAKLLKSDGERSEPADYISTGKDAGEIENNADVVMVLVEHVDRRSMYSDKLVCVAMAKVRTGKLGWLHLLFDGKRHRPAIEDDIDRERNTKRHSVQTSSPRTKSKGGLSSEYVERLVMGKKP